MKRIKKIITFSLILISPSTHGIKHCKGCLGSKWDAELAKKAQEKKDQEQQEVAVTQKKEISPDSNGVVDQKSPQSEQLEQEATDVLKEVIKAAHEVAQAEQENRQNELTGLASGGTRLDEHEGRGEKILDQVGVTEEAKSQRHGFDTSFQNEVFDASQKKHDTNLVESQEQPLQESASLAEVREIAGQGDGGHAAQSPNEHNAPNDRHEFKDLSDKEAVATESPSAEPSSDKSTIMKRAFQKIKRAVPKSTKGKVLAAATSAVGIMAVVGRLMQASNFFKKLVAVPSSSIPDILGAGDGGAGVAQQSLPTAATENHAATSPDVIPDIQPKSTGATLQPTAVPGSSSAVQAPSPEVDSVDPRDIDQRALSEDQLLQTLEANEVKGSAQRAAGNNNPVEPYGDSTEDSSQKKAASAAFDAEKAALEEQNRQLKEALKLEEKFRQEAEAARVQEHQEKVDAIQREFALKGKVGQLENVVADAAQAQRERVTAQSAPQGSAPRQIKRQPTDAGERLELERRIQQLETRLRESEKGNAANEQEIIRRRGSSKFNREDLANQLRDNEKLQAEILNLRRQVHALGDGATQSNKAIGAIVETP